ncbi:MAG: cysteine desulfurase family protein [Paracoccaceae bacterium]
MTRIYLDHNATTPLRSAAKVAMCAAMDVVGNPSSVHAEGRAAKGLIEQARGQLARALGAENADIIFTASATEAAALACAGRDLHGADIEHDAVVVWITADLNVNSNGRTELADPARSVLQLANSETGIVQDIPEGLSVCDLTQAFGKIPVRFDEMGIDMALISAHKLGGPKGVGALVLRRGIDVTPQIKGGGQEMGRRSGTENVIGISGFGAAAMAAVADVSAGKWEEIGQFRNILDLALEAGVNKTIFVGKDVPRLPNTTCFAAPGWKGETQVMQLDLSGFAISAGSACSSGKVRASRVLRAMGYNDDIASSAIRVSLGLETTEEDVLRFAEIWLDKREKHQRRVA